VKLLRLELENVRSYSSAVVDFANGVTLFEGDIGSGKSTLLYAVEFALFGLGEIKASHLLRHGAKNGRVRLDFEANGVRYAVERTLERRKAVTQGEGWLESDGVRRTLAPSEIKPAVLKILGFNEPPDAKSTSVIYRYAVFTPQEEMKLILAQKPDERLQTLRKAFGVEEYKNAKDNARSALQAMRLRANFLEGALRGLPALRESIASLAEAVEEERAKTIELETQAGLKRAALETAEAEFEALGKSKAAAAALAAEVPRLERSVALARAALAEYAAEAGRLAKKTFEMTAAVKPAKSSAALAGELRDAEAKARTLESEKARLQARSEDLARLVEKGACPTCGQETSAEGFKKKIEDNDEKEGKLACQAAGAHARCEELGREKDAAIKAEAAWNEAEKRKAEAAAAEERAKALSVKITVTEKNIASEEAELKGKKERLEEAKDALAACLEKEKGVRSLRLESGNTEKAAAAAHASLERDERSLAEARRGEEEARVFEAEATALSGKKAWLEEYFAPALDSIEEHVLRYLNREFNSLFSKWTAALLEGGDLEASLDESFAPTVTQNGYEQDVNALSGGEKTAVALAYRLALNELVKRECAAMKENLLILDEPTDGFSREQLERMRLVFDELKEGQVILVSHEPELEAFADNVQLVSKKGGASTVTKK